MMLQRLMITVSFFVISVADQPGVDVSMTHKLKGNMLVFTCQTSELKFGIKIFHLKDEIAKCNAPYPTVSCSTIKHDKNGYNIDQNTTTNETTLEINTSLLNTSTLNSVWYCNYGGQRGVNETCVCIPKPCEKNKTQCKDTKASHCGYQAVFWTCVGYFGSEIICSIISLCLACQFNLNIDKKITVIFENIVRSPSHAKIKDVRRIAHIIALLITTLVPVCVGFNTEDCSNIAGFLAFGMMFGILNFFLLLNTENNEENGRVHVREMGCCVTT